MKEARRGLRCACYARGFVVGSLLRCLWGVAERTSGGSRGSRRSRVQRIIGWEEKMDVLIEELHVELKGICLLGIRDERG